MLVDIFNSFVGIYWTLHSKTSFLQLILHMLLTPVGFAFKFCPTWYWAFKMKIIWYYRYQNMKLTIETKWWVLNLKKKIKAKCTLWRQNTLCRCLNHLWSNAMINIYFNQTEKWCKWDTYMGQESNNCSHPVANAFLHQT